MLRALEAENFVILEKTALEFGPGFTVHGDWLFIRGLWYGVALVVVGSIINVFVAFLYNLISDLVGGVEVTLTERR